MNSIKIYWNFIQFIFKSSLDNSVLTLLYFFDFFLEIFYFYRISKILIINYTSTNNKPIVEIRAFSRKMTKRNFFTYTVFFKVYFRILSKFFKVLICSYYFFFSSKNIRNTIFSILNPNYNCIFLKIFRFLVLLLWEIDVLKIFHMVDFFRFLSHRKGFKIFAECHFCLGLHV